MVQCLKSLGAVQISLHLALLALSYFIAISSGSEPTLDASNFKEELKKSYYLINFFSPYCSHCKVLSPIWDKASEKFEEENAEANLKFAKINCIENGDLCNQENIRAYPSIKLYGPDGFIKNYPHKLGRTVENLVKFATDESPNSDSISSPATSQQIQSSDVIDFLAGKANKPILISFWPGSQSAPIEQLDVSKNCYMCQDFYNFWIQLPNLLAENNIDVGHFGCESDNMICSEFGVGNEDTENESLKIPIVLLIKPNKKTNNFNVIKTKSEMDVNAYVENVLRWLSNGEYPMIDDKGLRGIIDNKVDYLDSNYKEKMVVTFAYNPETVFDEDFIPLEYLAESISHIDNSYLYRTTADVKKILFGLYEEIFAISSADSELESKMSIDDHRYVALNTLSQYPTFVIFKEGQKYPILYPGYSTTETRNLEYITSWINENSMPLMPEITKTNLPSLIEFNNYGYELLLIQLVDKSSEESLNESRKFIDDLITTAYKYEKRRMDYISDMIGKKRKQKLSLIRKLINKGKFEEGITDESLVEIEYENNKKLMLSYVDISQHKDFLNELGLKQNDVVSGNVIVIDKHNKKFITTDRNGETLTSKMSEVLLDTLVSRTLKGKILINSKQRESKLLLDYSSSAGFNFLSILAKSSLVFLVFFSLWTVRRVLQFTIRSILHYKNKIKSKK